MKRTSIVVAMLVLGACGTSPENHYYTLSASGKSLTKTNATISHVSISDMLDRPQMLVKSGTNNVSIREYERWAEPLDSMIARVLAEDMNAGAAATTHTRNIMVTIDELDADDTGKVTLKASWTLKANTGAPYAFEQSKQAVSDDADARVAAMSVLIGNLAAAIKNKM